MWLYLLGSLGIMAANRNKHCHDAQGAKANTAIVGLSGIFKNVTLLM
jgi:hypothetical protein